MSRSINSLIITATANNKLWLKVGQHVWSESQHFVLREIERGESH